LNLDITGLKTDDLIARLEVLVFGEAKSSKPKIEEPKAPKTKETKSE